MSRSNMVWALIVIVIVMGLFPPTYAAAYWQQNGNSLCTAANDQERARIVSDGAGGAIITWKDCRGGNYDVYAQRTDSTGTVLWTSDGVAICTTAAGAQCQPGISSDGAGGAIISWQDYRSGSHYDIYVQRVNSSGTVQWTTNGVAICTASNNQEVPEIISDGAGGAIIVWYDYRSGSDYDIYAQRVNSSGTVQWTVNGVAICTASDYQKSARISSDGAGGAIITWEDFRSGSYLDIYAQRVNSSGTVQWTANGVAICTASRSQSEARIVPDGSSGAVITWEDFRSGSHLDIYAQRVNSSGTVQWTADGVAICTATSWQCLPQIASDGSGGAIITWEDFRSGIYLDIYAQRVNSSGTVQWTVNGVAICTASDYQKSARISSDGAGGAIITWEDFRSGSHLDIYVQRVNSSGTVQWTANGVAICTAPNHQRYPEIISDGAGGAVIAWQDYRAGSDYDIYAARVWAEGSTVSWGTPFCGHISTDISWSGVLVITCDVTVSENAELTLKPGCILRFATDDENGGGNDHERCELIVRGTLTADGKSDSSVILTSAAESPAVKDWYGIRLDATNTSNVLDNCIVNYVYTAIELDQSTATVDSCLLSHFFMDGIKADASMVTVTRDSILLGNTGTRGVLLMSPTSATLSNNIITGLGSPPYGIEVIGNGSLTIENNTIDSVKWGMKLSGTDPLISDNTITRTTFNGIQCTGSASPIVRGTTIEDFTGIGVAAGEYSYPDLGTSADAGNNSILSHKTFSYYVANLVPGNTLKAELNWWGTDSPHAKKFYGDVDYVPWLDQKPQYALPLLPLHSPVPDAPYVAQNYPNPFNPQTTIEYGVSDSGGDVKVLVYDVSGRVVRVLVDEHRPAGYWRVVWDGRDARGDVAASGVYFYQVTIGDFRQTKKLILLR